MTIIKNKWDRVSVMGWRKPLMTALANSATLVLASFFGSTVVAECLWFVGNILCFSWIWTTWMLMEEFCPWHTQHNSASLLSFLLHKNVAFLLTFPLSVWGNGRHFLVLIMITHIQQRAACQSSLHAGQHVEHLCALVRETGVIILLKYIDVLFHLWNTYFIFVTRCFPAHRMLVLI